jgi:hypothetical protein
MGSLIRLVLVRILEITVYFFLDIVAHRLRRLWIRMKTKG